LTARAGAIVSAISGCFLAFWGVLFVVLGAGSDERAVIIGLGIVLLSAAAGAFWIARLLLAVRNDGTRPLNR
jgi:hypothetical protein